MKPCHSILPSLFLVLSLAALALRAQEPETQTPSAAADMEDSPAMSATDSGLVLSDEDVRQMHQASLRIDPRLRNLDAKPISMPDPVAFFAEKQGLGVEEVARRLIDYAKEKSADGRFDEVRMALGLLVSSGTCALMREHSTWLHSLILSSEARPVRLVGLCVLLDSEGTNAIPFLDSCFSDAVFAPEERHAFYLFLGSRTGGDGRDRHFPKQTAEGRFEWGEFMKRRIREEDDSRAFSILDFQMENTIPGWKCSSERGELLQRRAEECDTSAENDAHSEREESP